jgi:hypothetical protein
VKNPSLLFLSVRGMNDNQVVKVRYRLGNRDHKKGLLDILQQPFLEPDFDQ